MNEAQQMQALAHYKDYRFTVPVVHQCEWETCTTPKGLTEYARSLYVTYEGRTRRADFIVEFSGASTEALTINAVLADGTDI
jgi:hypothetical protein